MTIARPGSATARNACRVMPAPARCRMLLASNATAVCTSTGAASSIVHSVRVSCARTINSNTRTRVKYSNRRTTNASRAIALASIHAYDARLATAMTTSSARDSNTRKMARFHAQNAITRRRKRRILACRPGHTSSDVKQTTMIMMTTITRTSSWKNFPARADFEINFLIFPNKD